MKKQSLKLFLVLVLMLSTVLTACSGSESASSETPKEAEGKVVVDFWTFWGSETRRPIIEKIIDDFNKSQEEIYVKHTYLPWGDIWTKELAAVAAGNPPDVVINDINTVKHRATKEQAENLSEYITDENFKDKFFPELWNTVLYEGDPYAVPFNTDTRVLFYNKDMFKEAGLDPNQPPETWEEVEQYAEKLTVKNGDRYERIGFYPLWNVGADLWMLNADGEAYLNKDNEVVIDGKANVEALKWINSFTEKYGRDTVNRFKAEFGNQQAHPFLAGKIAMFTDVATFYTQIRDYGGDMNVGVAKLPAREEGSGHTSWGGGFVAEVPKGSDTPEEAVEFIKYLTGKEAQKYWAVKNFDNVANIAGAEAAAKELEGLDKKVYELAVENMDNTVLTPIPLAAPEYLNTVNPIVEEVLLGTKSPEEALAEAQKKVEELVKQN
ncbi:ABC transporter substrate-binding protein [Thalassobacillus pellis]|uniref:ABC transporter substrate-binding protein n=1 Tax=Thalassobacillus pellis TaxID=748008 RepID=UPI001960FCFC|nr:ABC transporter substrate-binding protein [Thalassobacillus pellis]MBM7551521.1 multiple sugar transport system substrate-binding protein [Thalassobacillus pellis]